MFKFHLDVIARLLTDLESRRLGILLFQSFIAVQRSKGLEQIFIVVVARLSETILYPDGATRTASLHTWQGAVERNQ